MPLHKVGDGLCLNGGGPAVALGFQSLEHGLTKAKIPEGNIAFTHIYRSSFLSLFQSGLF